MLQLCHIFQFNSNWGYRCRHAECFVLCRSVCFCQLDISQSRDSSDFCGVAFPLQAFYPYLGTLISWKPLGHSRPVAGMIYILTLLWARISYRVWGNATGWRSGDRTPQVKFSALIQNHPKTHSAGFFLELKQPNCVVDDP